jgi:dCMP deaminase
VREKHDRAHLGAALHYARSLSKDPNTKVGAVLVGPGGHGLCHGYNGFPRRVADTQERLANRELKNRLMVHAEMNAILVAASEGVRLRGSTLYLAATDDSGEIWGGPPDAA